MYSVVIAMAVDRPDVNPHKHALFIFTVLTLLYSPVIVAYQIGFVFWFTVVLIFLLALLYMTEILPLSFAIDIPLRALILVIPFTFIYLGFRATDATKATSILFSYTIILLLCMVLSYWRTKKETEAHDSAQMRRARKMFRELATAIEYLQKGHLKLPASLEYRVEEEMRRYHSLLEGQTMISRTQDLETLIVRMTDFYLKLRRAARATEPKLTAEFFVEEDLRDSEWSIVSVKVENIGAVDGKEVDIMIDGTVDLYRKTHYIEYLRRGMSDFARFQVRPHGHGKILMTVTLEVHSAVEDLDRYDWMWRYVYQFGLNVSENIRHTLEQVNVQGDFISGSKVSIQDSVVMRSKLG